MNSQTPVTIPSTDLYIQVLPLHGLPLVGASQARFGDTSVEWYLVIGVAAVDGNVQAVNEGNLYSGTVNEKVLAELRQTGATHRLVPAATVPWLASEFIDEHGNVLVTAPQHEVVA